MAATVGWVYSSSSNANSHATNDMEEKRKIVVSAFGEDQVPQIRKKVSNSWSAVEDTLSSTKDTFERHKIVFTVLTSVASIGTAWAGYTIRHLHETKVEQRLDSIENAVNEKKIIDLEGRKIKKAGDTGSMLQLVFQPCGVALVVGYGLGWRGGRSYAHRKFKREQMKLLGQDKPKRWQLKFLKRPILRFRKSNATVKAHKLLNRSIPDQQRNPREANPA
ncbi:hypothetical protein Tco_1077842 [Tanacetum coccineum]